MRKYFFMVIFMILTINYSMAQINIVDITHFDLGNGATITILPNQTLDDHIDLQPNFEPKIKIFLNGSEMMWTTNSDKTISNITFNFTADRFNFTAIGTSDPLNMTATMRRVSALYNFSVDSLILTSNTSDSNRQVSFTFNNWTVIQHDFVIEVNSSSIIIHSISGYIFNRFNDTLYNVNVTINGNYTHSNTLGYYNLSDLDPGNYTLRARLYPYANRSYFIEFTDTNIENFNITMMANTGVTSYRQDYTPIFALIFMITVVSLYAMRKGRKSKDENNEDEE